MKTLVIRWDTGRMEIILDTFFPTTQERFKKLLSLIRLDNTRNTVLFELKCYFMERLNCKRKPRTYYEKIGRHLNLVNLQLEKEKNMQELQKIDHINLFDFNVDMYGTFDEPLFIASEIADALGYAEGSASQLLKDVDDDEKLLDTVYRAGQQREVWFLTEDGLYEVFMQSRKPIAKQFKKGVKIALRRIRTGGYYRTRMDILDDERLLTITDARIFFTNFEGREEKFNEAGNRNFHVEIDADTAERLTADGWNVRTRLPRNEGDEETYSIKVRVNFDGRREPKIILMSGGDRIKINSENAKMIDDCDLTKIELSINGWEWEPGKMSGYLRSMRAIVVDDFVDFPVDDGLPF